MKSGKLSILVAVLLLTAFCSALSATVSGQVARGNGLGVPGCIVSLVNPAIGRSSPSVTDGFGLYSFANVPVAPSPYYLEVYWGQSLLFRTVVSVQGDVVLPTIFLQ
jgi:hypothetical protein